MAEKKDGQGADLKKEFGQLWKSAVDQLDEIKDVIVRSGHAGKTKLDSAMLKRERDKALEHLGRLTLEAQERLDLTPQMRDAIHEIETLGEQIRAQEAEFSAFVNNDGRSAPPAGAGTGEDAPDAAEDDAAVDDKAAADDADDPNATLTPQEAEALDDESDTKDAPKDA